MGKWADLNGQVIVRKDKHLSLKKVIEDFFDGEDSELVVYAHPFDNRYQYTDWCYKVELSVEAESYIAWEMFSDLKDTLTQQGCKCDFRVRIDL